MLGERRKMYFRVWLITYIIYLPILARLAGCDSLYNIYTYIQTDVKYAPFAIDFSDRTLRVCIIGSLVYWLLCACVLLNMKNYRYDEEYGSTKLGSINKLKRIYRCHKSIDGLKAKLCNLCFTEKVMMGLDVFRHNRNLNTLIIGGAGTWKTRGFILPNLLRANCSYVITDPKGEILAKIGKFLKIMGYKIRVLDLKTHSKSHCYNPFVYFRGDDDILKFVNQTWEAMSDKTAAKGEQIWDDQAKNMFISLLMYLYHYAPADEQNFDMLMKLIHEIKASEGAKQEVTAIDILFERIEHDSAAYGYYKGWSAAKGRTLASIVATLTAKLTVFNLDSLKKLTMCDDLNLTELATEKVALFCVIPDNDTSYNFIAGTLYSQLIQQLYEYADTVCHGPLPRHVRFLMDEFANVALPDDYEKILSTSRSRNISFAIVLQNKNQIEALYEKVYKSLIGNCDEILFLGSSEYDTCKYFSDLIGNETVYVKTYNTTHGSNASMTKNETKVGRLLFTPDELRKLDNKKAVLLIRGEDPVIDYKINLKRCKNYKYLADGQRFKDNMYEWGSTERSIGSMSIIPSSYSGKITPLPQTDAVFIDYIV